MNQVPGQPYLGYNGGYGGTQVIRIDDSETIKVLRENISILRERVAKYEVDQKKVGISRRAWAIVAHALCKQTVEISEKELNAMYDKAVELCRLAIEKKGFKDFVDNPVIFDLRR